MMSLRYLFLLSGFNIFVSLPTIVFHTRTEQKRILLSRYKGIWANIIGALLGTVTPFCSCSSIPILLDFRGQVYPIGVTFFIFDFFATRLISLLSYLLASIFNWTVAIAYVVTGLAVIGGPY